ncbi:hypothetical protein VPHD480_0178 [Vibrio phage D480]|nr:hypothetical protein MYOV011v1_p0036 [Vibrio phage 6E35.1a]
MSLFDANMRALPQGYEFVANVRGTVKELLPHVESGDYVRCRMLDECDKTPRVEIILKSGNVILQETLGRFDGWLTYEGHIDLVTDYPYEHIRAEAVEFFKRYDNE